jgi:hypothetical protein
LFCKREESNRREFRLSATRLRAPEIKDAGSKVSDKPHSRLLGEYGVRSVLFRRC